jgi:hypothetical protein
MGLGFGSVALELLPDEGEEQSKPDGGSVSDEASVAWKGDIA